MQEEQMGQLKVGELVAADYRYADVFKEFSIDFCCGGGKSLQRVCEEKGISKPALLHALNAVAISAEDVGIDFVAMGPGLLADYITAKHHTYVNNNLPLINEYALKVANAHGQHNPEVIKIAQLWNELSAELAVHMKKEELMLFPYIKQLGAYKDTDNLPSAPFGSVANPIRVMLHEHDTAGDLMKEIARLSNGYTPPEYACNTYRVLYAKLKEFEADLYKHVHLENNILFPRAAALEEKLLSNLGKVNV